MGINNATLLLVISYYGHQWCHFAIGNILLYSSTVQQYCCYRLVPLWNIQVKCVNGITNVSKVMVPVLLTFNHGQIPHRWNTWPHHGNLMPMSGSTSLTLIYSMVILCLALFAVRTMQGLRHWLYLNLLSW